MSQDLPAYTGQSCEWYDLPCHATSFAKWLFDALLFIPRKVFEGLLDALAALVEAIPVPDAIAQAKVSMSALAGMGYVADLVALKQGLALVMGSLIARFLLRRIPGIG